MKKFAILIAIAICGCFTVSAEPATAPAPVTAAARSKPVPFKGLTGTIAELLRTRPSVKLSLGSYSINLDDVVDKNINDIYTCDAVALKYLNECEECYYEQLASIIEEAIKANIDDQSATSYVFVKGSGTDNAISISIGVEYCKTVLLPVYVNAAQGDLKASFTVPCYVVYDFGLEIAVDSTTVLGDDTAKGVSIGLNYFTIEINPPEDDCRPEATAIYKGNLYALPLDECTLSVAANWHLCDSAGTDSEESKITYERLAQGDYTWDCGWHGSLNLSSKTTGEGIDPEDAIGIRLSDYDIANADCKTITVTIYDESEALPITQLKQQPGGQ